MRRRITLLVVALMMALSMALGAVGAALIDEAFGGSVLTMVTVAFGIGSPFCVGVKSVVTVAASNGTVT